MIRPAAVRPPREGPYAKPGVAASNGASGPRKIPPKAKAKATASVPAAFQQEQPDELEALVGELEAETTAAAEKPESGESQKLERALYVGNLPPDTTREEIKDVMSAGGEVELVTIASGKGKTKGMAFVQFKDEPSAIQAVLMLNGTTFKDRELTVDRWTGKKPVLDPDTARQKYMKGKGKGKGKDKGNMKGGYDKGGWSSWDPWGWDASWDGWGKGWDASWDGWGKGWGAGGGGWGPMKGGFGGAGGWKGGKKGKW